MTATLKDTTVQPTPKTWNAILKLAMQGTDCERHIDDLETARADLKGKLSEMGLGTRTTKTDEWQRLAASFAQVELTLSSERANLKNLARQSNKLITGAAQGRVFEDEEVDQILNDDGGPTSPLYENAMKAAQKAGYKHDVGEADADAAKRSTAKGDPGEGGITRLEDVQCSAVLTDSPDALAKLTAAKIITLADAAEAGRVQITALLGADLGKVLMTRIQQLRSVEPAKDEKPQNGSANGKHTKRGKKARDN